MTLEETKFFTFLDEYVRNQYRCFVAQMDLNGKGSGYVLCFRPTDVTRESPGRYACKYLIATLEQVRTARETGALPASLVEKLDTDLSVLGQSI